MADTRIAARSGRWVDGCPAFLQWRGKAPICPGSIKDECDADGQIGPVARRVSALRQVDPGTALAETTTILRLWHRALASPAPQPQENEMTHQHVPDFALRAGLLAACVACAMAWPAAAAPNDGSTTQWSKTGGVRASQPGTGGAKPFIGSPTDGNGIRKTTPRAASAAGKAASKPKP